MIVKGQAVKGAKRLASHLLKTENESVRILEVNGIDSSNSPKALRNALIDMEDIGKMTKTQTGRVLYHANIDPRKNESLTPEQYGLAADKLMKKLGLEGQPRILVEHVKKGRQHAHLVVQLTDIERGTVKQLRNNYYKQSALARELEQDFNLEPTPQRKTGKSYDMQEAQQVKKQGKYVQDYRKLLANTFTNSKNGQEFSERLRQQGYIIAKGNKRGLVILGKDGSPRSLTRDLKGTAKAKDVQDKLKDRKHDLPTVKQAKADVKELHKKLNTQALKASRQNEHEQLKAQFKQNFLDQIKARNEKHRRKGRDFER